MRARAQSYTVQRIALMLRASEEVKRWREFFPTCGDFLSGFASVWAHALVDSD